MRLYTLLEDFILLTIRPSEETLSLRPGYRDPQNNMPAGKTEVATPGGPRPCAVLQQGCGYMAHKHTHAHRNVFTKSGFLMRPFWCFTVFPQTFL